MWDQSKTMEKAKITTERVSATIKENEKTIVDEVMVELNTAEFSSEHRVLHGSFKARLNKHLDRPLAPGFYQLLLKDGRSHRIVVKDIQPHRKKALVRFLVVPEE